MRATEFDLVSSGLMAMMVLAGCAVLVLFAIWITDTELIPEEENDYPRTQLVSSSGSPVEWEFELPTNEETVALHEPSLQQIVQQVESIELAQFAAGQDDSGTRPNGQDFRDAAGEGGVPRFQRWHLLFSATTRAIFAQQLDALEIELGVFGGGSPGIDYARGLSTQIQKRHNNTPETEERLYFSWARPSPLAGFERDLLVKAGVRVSGRQIVKFLPPDLEKQLAQLESNYAHTRGVFDVGEIAKTVFQCQGSEQAYRFVVIDQRYVGVP
jgi:hypothetical protein